MFKEVNIDGRYALRSAVRAAAYADISKDQDSNALATKALHCYGMALSALGDSLSTPGKAPDDYDLMAVVMLDIFEVFMVLFPFSSGFLTHVYRRYTSPAKSREGRMPKEWHRSFVCAAQT